MPEARPSPKYIQYPGIEFVSLYRKGGYHPVNVGDVFHNQYRVVNKLGYGVHGTVWLVEDTILKRFASLKVLTADASAISSELAVFRHLRVQQQQIPPAAGAAYVMKVFDDFEIEGPNGTHQCVVTELLGPSLAEDIEELYTNERFPPNVGKKIAAQIAHGIAYLHRCGVIHGDLHLKNILLHHPSLENCSLHEIQLYFGTPETLPIARRDALPITPSAHLPRHLVASSNPLPLLKLCLAFPQTVCIKICDFGEALLYRALSQLNINTPIQSNMPRVFAPPEILLHEATIPQPAMDIWALAVLLHMILTGGGLLFSSYHGIEKEVIREIVLTLGKLPERWWTQWVDRGEYFDENGMFVGDQSKLPKISRKLVKLSVDDGFSEEDLRVFEDLVRKMARYETNDRISADEVVRLIPAAWMTGA
ncbi:Serine/threonine-protein kinase SRPK [Hypsizygus marmoreus]|uniref:non-specific serine/threonine protein kinase n=1 Tax=Hypsizygus marmoreus TaxID=39966 RepID=A0A369JNJ7_HYPMA|nr:Serine/threonine-protein kinase SRPK [Hypsizygus marmoreus]